MVDGAEAGTETGWTRGGEGVERGLGPREWGAEGDCFTEGDK